jgi:hypothetical protein
MYLEDGKFFRIFTVEITPKGTGFSEFVDEVLYKQIEDYLFHFNVGTKFKFEKIISDNFKFDIFIAHNSKPVKFSKVQEKINQFVFENPKLESVTVSIN